MFAIAASWKRLLRRLPYPPPSPAALALPPPLEPRAGAHKRARFTICPFLPSHLRFFAALFAPWRVLPEVTPVRGVAGEAPRWNTYRDNYVTFCFATTRDFFLASVPAPRRAPIGPTPRSRTSGRVVPRPARSRRRGERA